MNKRITNLFHKTLNSGGVGELGWGIGVLFDKRGFFIFFSKRALLRGGDFLVISLLIINTFFTL